MKQNDEINKKKTSDSSGAYNVSRGYGGKFGVEQDRMDRCHYRKKILFKQEKKESIDEVISSSQQGSQGGPS